MKRFNYLALLVLLVTGFFNSALAQVPKLTAIPETLSTSPRYAELVKSRATLVQQRDTLRAAVEVHNKNCTSVIEGTPLAEECARKWTELEKQRKSYSEAVEKFNQSLAIAIAADKVAASLGLKESPKNKLNDSPNSPSILKDSSVVDARNVPSGLPKAVEDSIPNTPAGHRTRKGLQAVALRDWKVALAWFQDALHQEPNNPEIQKLVDFAQSSLNETAPDLSKEMLHALASRDLERTRRATERDATMMRKLAEWKSKPNEPMNENLMIWLLAQPRPSTTGDGTHWLQGVKEDPRYKEIQSRWQDTKDMALLFQNKPAPTAVKQYEWELQDFYAAWATKQGYAKHYGELRKSSEALANACDQIEADKKSRLAAESTRWEKDWAKALANPNNRSDLKSGDPDVIGPEARHAITEHLLQVQAIEEATQKRLLDAGHQILTLGKPSWTP